jgi:AAA+ ATPase superfamily predicted ATPase
MDMNSETFFGREGEMRIILDFLTSSPPQCVSIIGTRRIGKSSLAMNVFQKIKDLPNTIAVFFSCDSLPVECESKDEFFKLLYQKFKEENPFVLASKKYMFHDYESFQRFIKENSTNAINTFIFLDEFENLPTKKFADSDFFYNLKAKANIANNRLAFITTSQSELENLTPRTEKGSAFWNIFQQVWIGLFDHKNTLKLRRYGFEKCGLTLEKNEEEKIHYYAGNFPFFNQLACDFLWRAKRYHSNLDWDTLERDLHSHYLELWQSCTKSEQKQLKKLKIKYKKENRDIKNLWKGGLLIKTEEGYQPFSALFIKFLKSKSEFKITRKKFPLKAFMKYIKELLKIATEGKKLTEGD